MTNRPNPPTSTLRLIWPQWQGASPEMVEHLVPELPLEEARRGYALGSKVLEAVLPAHDGPTATVPVTFDADGTERRGGVDAKDAVVRQLAAALGLIRERDPERIVTVGGECSVSVGPFSALAHRYGDDLAIVWVDSHPDIGTPGSEYPGYHAMAVATLTGHGDPDVQALLPATVSPTRVAIAGLHSWTDDDIPNVAAWGIQTFSPDDLRSSSAPLLQWLAATGCTKVAVHFDLDVVDANEIVFGLGAEPGGLTTTQARRVVSDVSGVADVVGLTIAEYVPRQVMALQRLVRDLPLL